MCFYFFCLSCVSTFQSLPYIIAPTFCSLSPVPRLHRNSTCFMFCYVFHKLKLLFADLGAICWLEIVIRTIFLSFCYTFCILNLEFAKGGILKIADFCLLFSLFCGINTGFDYGWNLQQVCNENENNSKVNIVPRANCTQICMQGRNRNGTFLKRKQNRTKNNVI